MAPLIVIPPEGSGIYKSLTNTIRFAKWVPLQQGRNRCLRIAVSAGVVEIRGAVGKDGIVSEVSSQK